MINDPVTAGQIQCLDDQLGCTRLRGWESLNSCHGSTGWPDRTADIVNTVIGGSRVVQLIDGKPAASRLVWARPGKEDKAVFKIRLEVPGQRVLQVGDRKVPVIVR